MSEANKSPVHVRHRLVVAELTSGHARKPVEMVNWIQGASNETGEVAGRVKLNDFAQALADAESTQPAERDGEWVSIADRTPEQAQRVLFWAAHWDDLWPRSGIWDGQMGWFLGDDGCRSKTIAVTIYWMPLPAPPHPKGTK